MLRYAVGRVLLIIPTLILVIFIVFTILNITPGDPGRIMLGQNASQEAVDELNRSLGMDRPLLVRFWNYLMGVLRLDFGVSWRSGMPVVSELLKRVPVTLTLGVLSLVVNFILGVILGVISAVRQYSILDYGLTVASLIFASMPGFVLALVLILIFSLVLGILPSSGIGSIKHFILPVCTSALPGAAFQARVTRASMLETMRQDYIRTAKAKGASKKRVLFRHALKPALTPFITSIGMGFAVMLGGSMITENIFALPGVGNIILTAVRMKDAPVILASAIFLAAIYKIMMLVVDVVMTIVDPRIKSRFAMGR